MAYLIIAKEPLFRQDLLQWNRRPAVDKTWPNMMEHFRDAQSDLNSLPTAGDVYHQHHGNANSVIAIADLVAQRLLDAAEAAKVYGPPETSLPAANAVIHTDASLAIRDAALLTQMQAMMAAFAPAGGRNNRNNNRTNNRTRGNRFNNDRAPAPVAPDAPNIRPARTPSPRAYCWSHGMCAHTSALCNNQLPGHQVAATFTNMLGGNTNQCFWLPHH